MERHSGIYISDPLLQLLRFRNDKVNETSNNSHTHTHAESADDKMFEAYPLVHLYSECLSYPFKSPRGDIARSIDIAVQRFGKRIY